jgi:hypothetical protein
VLKEPRLDFQGSKKLFSALRLGERYTAPIVVAITSSEEILARFRSGVSRTDHMRIGHSTKTIWNTKFADVGRPFAELPAIVKRILDDRKQSETLSRN